MASKPYGRVIIGEAAEMDAGYRHWEQQPVDQEMLRDDGGYTPRQTTLGGVASVTGPGTFFGKTQRTLTFEPADSGGWRFDREDLPDSLPISVSPETIWTTVRNIVLSSGSPHNYMRMVEHIVALRTGLGIDHVLIRMNAGDPPLFDRSSMPLVEAFDAVGTRTLQASARYVTVREPVAAMGPYGSFLVFLPAEDGARTLEVDCALHFRTAIGKQRVRFTVTPETFRYGAAARTNTNFWMMLYCKTIGKIFADVRHLGYTTRNILVAGKHHYINRPLLIHNGKSLEAGWHRATLDLLAAVALIDRGRLAGKVISCKAGHALDCRMVQQLSEGDWLVDL